MRQIVGAAFLIMIFLAGLGVGIAILGSTDASSVIGTPLENVANTTISIGSMSMNMMGFTIILITIGAVFFAVWSLIRKKRR
jgi:heme/copper-type cytochrome/quinol oxidase subunit 2